MKLVTLEIQNYRSLFGDAEGKNQLCLDLADGMNTIVGPNNCGKSNIFRALAVALDPKFQFDRKQDMPAQAVWAKPTITLTFQIGKSPTSSERTLLKHLNVYEKAANPKARATFASERKVKYRVTIEGGLDSLGSRRETFIASGAGARTLPSDDPRSEKVVAQLKRCFHFVYIQSGQSLASLLEGKFRDILRSVLKEQLSAEYNDAEKSRSAYVEGIQTGLLKPLTDRIGMELKDLFPEVTSVQLRPEVGQLEQTLTRMGVTITDSVSTDLADKGTGVRGGVVVAMLRHLADEGRRSLLFAVEEPETFLHPAAQESLREDLEALAKRAHVSLLVTTHSPFVVSRSETARVFSLAKDATGRTFLAQSAAGNEAHAGALGALFRSRLVVDVLDRAAQIPQGTAAIVVVEGYTDEQYLRIVDGLLPGPSRLRDVAIVQAGIGVGDGQQGGAALAVMQALVARATSGLPVVALFDNDSEGNAAAEALRKIRPKTGDWQERKTLLQYSVAIPNASSQFAYEAEDLWPDKLVKAFVDQAGEDSVLTGKQKRPNPFGGWQYSLTAAAKGQFVDYLRTHATAADGQLWAELFKFIRAGAGLTK